MVRDWLIKFKHIDWWLFLATLPLLGAGLVTMHSFTEASYYFERQLIWITLAFGLFFVASLIDWRFLRQSGVIVTIFMVLIFLLFGLSVFGRIVKGAQSWFSVGGVSLQPADFMKLALIFILAKYFSRRHIEIAYIRHILISGIYAAIPFVLILLQPDFGSAVIIFLIWFGMIVASGISKKHLFAVFSIGLIGFVCLWLFVFQPYQKARLLTFIDPLADARGAGYNVAQSMIAVGSGQWFGKGVGHGTQSRLKFLPEYQTDFIFAAFAEEWGFVGGFVICLLFGIIIWRILVNALLGASNFESLYGMGVAILFLSHFVINIGMNIGLLPVTGLTLPFLSYGGSHLLVEFLALGILMGMRRYNLSFHRDDAKNEFLGLG